MSAQTIGWTLIHSLWQGLVIYLLLKITNRFVDRSDVKYGLGVAGMGLLVICSIGTCIILSDTAGSPGYSITIAASPSVGSSSSTSTVLQFIDQNIVWLIRFWVLGFTIGLLRIAAGLWYIARLRRNAHPVQDEWMELVKRLSEHLNINRVVAMAEASISSPMVVGFMKPVILFPVGLLSGLTTEQVETILVHELSHIRRQDYIVNLVQSVVETIFFFNPFALLISSAIREERENCCDDVVIANGVSPINYVKILAQLEAARSLPAGSQGSASLAIGFTGNQNQLLNRIKRIMENSAKNDWGKGRFIPIALLFLGLVCASWLSIGSEKEINEIKSNYKVLASDTSREDGLVVIKRGNGYNSWTVIGPHDPPPVEEEFGPVMPVEPMDMDFEFPPIPEFADVPDMDFGFDFGMNLDSIREFEFYGPDSIPAYHFRLREPVDFEQFEKEFTEKFQKEFKEFYEKNQDQIKKMMEDAKRNEASRREAAEVVDLAELHRMSELQFLPSEDMLQAKKQIDMISGQKDILQLQKIQMDAIDEQLRQQNYILDDMHRNSEAYNEQLIKMLAEDGYIKDTDAVGDLQISDLNGELMINGHKIKEKDAVKYRALNDTFFGSPQKIKRDTHRRSE